MRMPTPFVCSCTGLVAALLSLGQLGCSEDEGGSLFPVKPECAGEPIVAYQGMSPQVISAFEIGGPDDGFDLDHDGKPDNKLSAVAGLAKAPIADSLKNYELVIPLEFFDAPAAAIDACIKFAIYLGDFVKDADADGADSHVAGGDCNDHAMAINKDAVEVPGNGKDDDCDGLADEDPATNAPTTSTADADADGVTLAQGDCDDTNPTVKLGAAEICGDGFDNDCDGVADRTTDGSGGSSACSPFAPTAEIALDPLSFSGADPVIAFNSGTITDVKGTLKLVAGPSIFSVSIPVTNDITLTLKISGATIEADVVAAGSGFKLENGRLGGVIDAKTADTIRGLTVDQIGLTPENSLLDATFANLLGPLLALPKASLSIQQRFAGCRTPDIDVDRDGLEAFCDTDPDTDPNEVDICIDGDGTEISDIKNDDGTTMIHCSEAMVGGKDRFVDGISVEFNFATSPIAKIKAP